MSFSSKKLTPADVQTAETDTLVKITAAAYTVGPDDGTIIVTAAATCVLTLPTPSTNNNRVLKVITQAAFAVNSASANVKPLAGGSNSTAIVGNTAGSKATLRCDGTSWLIIG